MGATASKTGTPDETRDSSYRPDIEGLRGVAILLVLAFHMGLPGITGGFIGVDVFYVLSGYLISGLMVREIESTGRLDFVRFYARRARRLLPAAALTLAATVLLGFALYSPIEMNRLAQTASSVALYVSNFQFARNSIDYLLISTDVDPLLHTWSLAVEEQFYLAWPLMVVLLMWLGRRYLGSRRVLTSGIATVTLSTFILCVWLTNKAQPWAFFASPPRFWEFGLGALALILQDQLTRWFTRNALLSLICLALIIGPAFAFNSFTTFPSFWAAVPALGAAGLLIVGAVRPQDWVIGLLNRRPLLWFGRHSYSWYLWHWPLIVFATVLWPSPPLFITVAAGLLALGCSVITFRLIEHPIRFNPYLRRRPVLSIGMGLGLVVVSLALAGILQLYAGALSSQPAQQLIAGAKNDTPRIYAQGCVAGFLDLQEVNRDCAFGDIDSNNTVVLFGDSHAGQWFPAVEQLALAQHWRLLVKAKSSCPTAMLPMLYNFRLHRSYTECTQWRKNTIEQIVSMRPTLVIMSNDSNYVGEDKDLQVTTQTWQDGLRKTVATFDAAGITQVLIVDTPWPGFDAPICLSRAATALIGRRGCDFELTINHNNAVTTAETALMAQYSRGGLIDLTAQICPAPVCKVERDGLVMYSDSNHLTASFDATLAPALASQIEELLARIAAASPAR